MTKNKILVSGAHGFIGNRITEILKANSIPRNLLYDLKDLTTFLKGYDTVIHCSSYGNHAWQKDLRETYNANVLGTFNLLESCRLSEVNNFINIGSSSEYGDKNKPMIEEMIPETNTMYGCTKVCGTYLTRHYSNYFNTITVRPFSVYGEQEDERRFIPMAIKHIKEQSKFTLYEGNHDWIYIDDFVNGIKKVIENADILNGLVINIGNGKNFSNLEVLETLELIAGKDVDLEMISAKKSDSKLWVANCSKIKSLGWKPKVSLYKGLKRVYEAKNN